VTLALLDTDRCFADIGEAALRSVLDLRQWRSPEGLVNRSVLDSPRSCPPLTRTSS